MEDDTSRPRVRFGCRTNGDLREVTGIRRVPAGNTAGMTNRREPGVRCMHKQRTRACRPTDLQPPDAHLAVRPTPGSGEAAEPLPAALA